MIRRACEKDIDAINKLGNLLHNDFDRLFHIETEIASKYGIVLISEENESINGFLYAVDAIDTIDLLSIVVDIKARNNGVASSLLNHLILQYGEKRPIVLEVDQENKCAIGLYEKFHFKIKNIRKGYYNGKDALLMIRGGK